MQYVMVGLFVAFGVAQVVAGVVELRTGWIHPWERGRVVRPVPHGIGQLLTGSGLGFLVCVVAFAPPGDALPRLLAAGVVPFLVGTFLLFVSGLPDRR